MMHHHASSLVKYVLPVAIDISNFQTQKAQTISADPDQTAYKKQSDHHLPCLLFSVILFENTKERFSKFKNSFLARL